MTALCPVGWVTTGGGGSSTSVNITILQSYSTLDGGGWTVTFRNTDFGASHSVITIAHCVEGTLTNYNPA